MIDMIDIIKLVSFFLKRYKDKLSIQELSFLSWKIICWYEELCKASLKVGLDKRIYESMSYHTIRTSVILFYG